MLSIKQTKPPFLTLNSENSFISMKGNQTLYFGLWTLDEYLEYLGSSWVVDGLYLFICTPLSIVGFFLNLLNLFLMFKINIKNNINDYLKIYILNQLVEICDYHSLKNL